MTLKIIWFYNLKSISTPLMYIIMIPQFLIIPKV